jgi:hypothetical protein
MAWPDLLRMVTDQYGVFADIDTDHDDLTVCTTSA